MLHPLVWLSMHIGGLRLREYGMLDFISSRGTMRFWLTALIPALVLGAGISYVEWLDSLSGEGI